MGIEPTFAAWEAAVLPMNYIRVCPAGVAPGHRSENGERVLTGHAWKVGDNYVRRGTPLVSETGVEPGDRPKWKSLLTREIRPRSCCTIFAHAVWSLAAVVW